MKALLLSLMFVVFAQGANAETVEFDEALSKKLYHILATFGLRTPNAAVMQTQEWAHPAVCLKTVNGTAKYTCGVHDEFRNQSIEKSGGVAKKLYDMIVLVNPALCGAHSCQVRTEDIKCIYFWWNKDNPPERRYWCSMQKYDPSVN